MNRIAFILDKSGSMDIACDETISSFNRWLEDMKIEPNHHATLVLTLFDTESRVAYEGPLLDAPKLDRASYAPGGSTALLDATHVAMKALRQVTKKGDRALVVIVTDGEENSSKHITKDVLHKSVKTLEAKGWEFVFMGANIDSFAEAGKFGVANAANYSTQPGGTQSGFTNLTSSTTNWSTGGSSTINPNTAGTNVTPPRSPN